MEKKFEEKIFIATIKQLKEILPYVNSNHTAETFLETALLQCGFDKDEMFSYYYAGFMTRRPDLIYRFLDIDGWKEIYRDCTKICDDDMSNIITGVLDIFDKSEAIEKYFDLITDILGIDKSVSVGAYLIRRIGWLNFLNSLVIKGETCEEVSESKVSAKKHRKVRIKEGMEPVVKSDETIVETESSDSIIKGTGVSVVDESKQLPTYSGDECVSRTEETIVEKDSSIVVDVEMKTPIDTKGKRRYKEPIVRFTLEGLLVDEETFECAMDAQRKTGIKRSNIWACLNGKVKSAGGYVWKYLSEVKLDESSKCTISPSSTETDNMEKKKLYRTGIEKTRLVAYRYNGKELDETCPIGEFKNQREVADFFRIPKCSVSKHLSHGYNHNRLKWFKDKEKTTFEWIALKMVNEAA